MFGRRVFLKALGLAPTLAKMGVEAGISNVHGGRNQMGDNLYDSLVSSAPAQWIARFRVALFGYPKNYCRHRWNVVKHMRIVDRYNRYTGDEYISQCADCGKLKADKF